MTTAVYLDSSEQMNDDLYLDSSKKMNDDLEESFFKISNRAGKVAQPLFSSWINFRVN